MFKQFSSTEKLAVAAPSCVLAALALVASLKFALAPSYADFIVGNIAWQADTKLQDLIAAPVLIAVLFFGVLFLSLQLIKQKQQFGEGCSIELSNQLIWWSVPSIAAIFSLTLGFAIDEKLLIMSSTGIGLVAIISASCTAKKIKISPEIIGVGTLSIMLAGLIPLEIALVLGRAPIALVSSVTVTRYEMATYVVSGIGLLFWLLYGVRYPEKLSCLLPKLILIGQIGLPTLFLSLYPARLLQPNGILTKYQTTWEFRVLVAGMVAWGMFDVIRRYRKFSTIAGHSRAFLFSPIALFGLLIALKVGNTIAPFISPDDYHFGEMTLGVWSYLHGVIPYVGYIPSHGIVSDDLSSFLSYIFYDGTAGSFVDAGRLSYALLAFATFISIYRFSGSIVLAFVSTFFVGGNLAWLFFTPFLCLWFSRSLCANPAKWLSVWMITAIVVILAVPGQGMLLVAASGIMALYMIWGLWQDATQRKWMSIGISLLALIVAALATPMLQMLLGAIQYVLENGPINQTAYGVSWALSWKAGANAGFIFEAIRMSWVVVPFVCMILIYSGIKDQADRKNVVLPAVVVFLFVMLLVPYSMGRIDPGGVSRPGVVAIFCWAVLLPVTTWRFLAPANRAALILLIAGISATLNFTQLSVSNLISAASAQVNTGILKNGPSAGLANIGMATVQDAHWDRLTRLNALLNNKLAPDESYLDLTSRNAQYFYLNRLPMMAVSAPYNMAPPTQQERAVKQLSQNLPRVALLDGANIIHDGGGLALRDPYLYRFTLNNYLPQFEDGFIFGYKRTIGLSHAEPVIDVVARNLTDENWDRGVNRREPAILIENPVLLSLLAAGTQVRIGADEMRRINRVSKEENTIWLDGSVIDAAAAGYPKQIQVLVTPGLDAEYRVALFEKAFALSDFKKIPVAWGRSERSLARKMTLITKFDALTPSIHDLVSENGHYKVTGIDPLLSFDISDLNLAGTDAGLLRFSFSCINRSSKPRIQVFWWGDDHNGPFEVSSVRFTADDGTLIVPLEASPRWLATKHVKGIRIDLDNASACTSFNVKDISLLQRHLK